MKEPLLNETSFQRIPIKNGRIALLFYLDSQLRCSARKLALHAVSAEIGFALAPIKPISYWLIS